MAKPKYTVRRAFDWPHHKEGGKAKRYAPSDAFEPHANEHPQHIPSLLRGGWIAEVAEPTATPSTKTPK